MDPKSDSDSVAPPKSTTSKRLLQATGNLYRIQIINAEYPNRLVTDINALKGSGNPPIFAVVDLEDDTQVVCCSSFVPIQHLGFVDYHT